MCDLFIPCFSPAGAGGRSNNAMVAELNWIAFTYPPVSPHDKIASLVF